MKVQKMVSLDQETARIAGRMNNFSRFVRIALSAHANGEGIDEVQRRQRVWKRVSDGLLDVIRHETGWDDDKMAEMFLDVMANARNQVEFDVLQD